MLRQMHLAAILALLSSGLASAADNVPRLDVSRTCRNAYDVLQDTSAAARAGKASEADVKQAYNACINSENSARESASQRWSRIRGENRRTCVTMASAMFPSYVELDACLQMYDEKDPALSGGAPSSTSPARKR